MRMVQPAIFLIAKPSVDWVEVRRYLEEVDGTAWLDRLDAGPDAEHLIEFGGRLCYRSWDPGLNPNVTRVREDSTEYHRNVLASRHGSVLHHSNFSFVLHNVSRVFTHEQVRHAIGAAVSQESMRFVRLTEIPMWFPEWALEDEEFMTRALMLLEDLENFQKWMAEYFGLDDPGKSFAEKKAKTSFMRRFAPDGVATGMLLTVNVRAIRHIMEIRTDPAAEEEIRLVWDLIALKMKEEAPALFQDFTCEGGAWKPEWSKV